MEGTSNMLEGSSRRRRSGSQNRALANANLILHPPEKVFVAKCCRSSEKPRPARILAARDSALSDSISESFAWMSLRVVSRPSRSLSSLSASVEVSASGDLSVSISASCLPIFSCSARRCFRHTSASKTACKAGVSSPVISCST